MIKSVTVIEFKIGERIYQFHCSPESPLGEIHDALCMMKHEIVQRISKQDELEKEKKNVEP